MANKTLTENVIKKIKVTKLLYDLGNNSFRVSENSEQIGAGIVLLQDAVELFLMSLCEHLDVEIGEFIRFREYFDKLKNKTNEEIPLRKQILNLNRQRVNLKHHGLLPNFDDCKDFPNTVRMFFVELSDRYLKMNFDSITLVELLKEGEAKDLLKEAEAYLKSKKYKECQTNCRKALYIRFESRFDIRPFEQDKYHGNYFAAALFSDAPHYVKNKEWIEENVGDPTQYISIDHEKLGRELLHNGIIPTDFWNIWRLTPSIYYYEDTKEWVVKDEFKDDAYNEENAEYCFRKTVEILLLIQKNWEQTKSIKSRGALVKTKDKKVKVFERASIDSKVAFEFENGPIEIYTHGKVRGLHDMKNYYDITHTIEKEWEKKVSIFGYICEDDIETNFV